MLSRGETSEVSLLQILTRALLKLNYAKALSLFVLFSNFSLRLSKLVLRGFVRDMPLKNDVHNFVIFHHDVNIIK